MAKFSNGQKLYIIENNRRVTEVTVLRSDNQQTRISLPTGAVTVLWNSRLYEDRAEAEAVLEQRKKLVRDMAQPKRTNPFVLAPEEQAEEPAAAAAESPADNVPAPDPEKQQMAEAIRKQYGIFIAKEDGSPDWKAIFETLQRALPPKP